MFAEPADLFLHEVNFEEVVAGLFGRGDEKGYFRLVAGLEVFADAVATVHVRDERAVGLEPAVAGGEVELVVVARVYLAAARPPENVARVLDVNVDPRLLARAQLGGRVGQS